MESEQCLRLHWILNITEFFSASNVKNNNKTGSVLRLAIDKQIVTNHKGRIWVERKPGVGTKFTFT
jgi:signal transduction histidine kinase